ncbi:MAG TPA: hypothetical protein PLU67_05470 [Candidatus Kapabacteria bacterium]|jgi:hypothetical protein|nr:MAG: hypothetical protein BWY47_01297 [Bacteroidetes bacterium ADurb.Bin302]HOM04931.1 hypothetical protein [Candidatus Kapabacteria bacterium]HPP39920.1 hypothetical protein [Candidatus Kapabacteria bacterium]HPU23374.1 hypothetical protein [Candidatus Kapabacteria bacterium]
MKTIFIYVLLLLFSVKSYSVELNLKNGILAYNNSLHIDKTGSKYFVKVTFSKIPLQSVFEEIESKGIKFLEYVPHNAYYCLIDTKSIIDNLEKYGIISIDTIQYEKKISSELIDGIPDWMEVDEGLVKLNIEYFKGKKISKR